MSPTRGKRSGVRRAAKQVLADTFGVAAAELADDVAIDDLEKWDSMNHTLLILALEERFHTSFSLEEAVEATSLDAIVAFVEGRRRKWQSR